MLLIKNKIRKIRKKTIFSLISFVFLFSFLFSNVSVVYAVCHGTTGPDGILDSIEICDGTKFRGGVTTCAELGDTNSVTSDNDLVCKVDCTIDYVASGCTNKFQNPTHPKNVPVDLENAIMNLTNWILGFVSIIAVLALIWGGVQYMTSSGNDQQTETGKNVIKYALIGLIVSGLAYAIIRVIVTVILT